MNDAVCAFLSIDPKASGKRIAIFLYIACHAGCTVEDIGKAINVNYPVIYKHLNVLGTDREHALGLVEREKRSDVYPREFLHLTPRGQELVEELKKTLTGI